MKPDFSILMSSFNKSPYIGEAIDSVLNQTFSNWELVIIDDKSTDNSLKIIKPYLNDKRIKFFVNTNNIGPVNVQRMMIEKASAPIVGILDSDDALHKNAVLEILKEYQKNYKLGFVYSQCFYCDEELKEKHLGYARKTESGKSNLHYNRISHFRTFRKDAYFKTDGYDSNCLFAEDADIMFKLEEVTSSAFVDKALYYYRILPKSHIHGFKNEMMNRSSTALARLNAYERRLGTDIPNLFKVEICEILFFGISSSFFARRFKLSFNFFKQIFKIYPIFFLDPRFYYLMIKKIFKIINLKLKSI